ncbi:Leucyl/phenylalanyl-tRNA--protein transferase [Pseudobythopirellula maris]|uniref:Leucyl/phenylalanyl-tRNA--protein transferase n=1 Tax=Pseudobythopirellula maris TaxID=2527991 RepID=A0A5C5ZTQ3_9BACT|nr:leucyl/phenylalanyl-tRNA--protein transferase [Pseudobythopirellula maris]TWT90447.1 Leucyl/phenylalanyl-tRNA--protein transferase [Pseudobythopirellula maris]
MPPEAPPPDAEPPYGPPRTGRLEPSRYFPAAEGADDDGFIGLGGELSPEWLLDAYRHGIFPWPHDDDDATPWWSPNPRAVFEPGQMHVSRRLARTIRSGKFTVTSDRAFARVMQGCANGKGREGGTWITPAMREAYTHMHELGWGHSVEAWLGAPEDDQLVGGVYGLAIGGLFAAESMFHRERDASKVALAALVRHTAERGYRLLDIQQWTPHTGSLGAREISRDEYLGRLATCIDLPVTFGAIEFTTESTEDTE